MIKLELAGISPDEVEIINLGSSLRIRGKRRDMLLRQGFACHSMEITYSSFERVFSLPANILTESIDWMYQQGILLITFSLEAPAVKQ